MNFKHSQQKPNKLDKLFGQVTEESYAGIVDSIGPDAARYGLFSFRAYVCLKLVSLLFYISVWLFKGHYLAIGFIALIAEAWVVIAFTMKYARAIKTKFGYDVHWYEVPYVNRPENLKKWLKKKQAVADGIPQRVTLQPIDFMYLLIALMLMSYAIAIGNLFLVLFSILSEFGILVYIGKRQKSRRE